MSFRFLVISVLFLTTLKVHAQECPRERHHLRISFVGDILVHEALFRFAVKSPKTFRTLWGPLTPILKDADYTVGNLEGPVAPGVLAGGKQVADPGLVYDGKVYSGTNFVFNYHPQLLADLKTDGFDFVSTANNHSLDRRSIGVDLTIAELQKVGLEFSGTRARGSQRPSERIVEIRGRRVAFVSCAEMTNGIPDPDKLVTLCGSSQLPQIISELSQKAEAVIVLPHWGAEYVTEPNARQKKWARQWVAAGASAIVGHHPHVLQSVEWLPHPKGGEAPVIYSLGNFIAAMGAMPKRVATILHLDFARGRRGLEVAQYSHTPFMRPSGSISLLKLSSEAHREEWSLAQSLMGFPRCERGGSSWF